MKKACLNVQNKGVRCFQYAMLSWAKFKDTKGQCVNAQRASTYHKNPPPPGRPPKNYVPELIDSELDFSMLTFPVSVEALPQFEEANKIHLYVFTWKNDAAAKVYPRRRRL